MEFRTLRNIPVSDFLDAFNKAFSDYFIKARVELTKGAFLSNEPAVYLPLYNFSSFYSSYHEV